MDVAVFANEYRIIGNRLGPERIVGKNNVVSQNQIVLCDYVTGFWLTSSSNMIIESNSITLTRLTTFFLSTDNADFHVYHNNFFNVEVQTGGYLLLIFNYPQNHLNATSPPWDNDYPAGGNYWSDYKNGYPSAVEQAGSGIGDTPYVSQTTPTVIDRYPLIKPYNFSPPTITTQNITNSQNPTPTNSTTENQTETTENPQPDEPINTSTIAIIAIILSTTFSSLLYIRKQTQTKPKHDT
jgi:hypothetical protein